MGDSTERMRRHRDRQKSGEELPKCGCGKRLQGQLSKARGVCSVCWKKTDEGRAETLARVRKIREQS